jgi:hypothetical protein
MKSAPYKQYRCSGETKWDSLNTPPRSYLGENVSKPGSHSSVPFFFLVVVNDMTFHKEENGRTLWCHTECSG